MHKIQFFIFTLAIVFCFGVLSLPQVLACGEFEEYGYSCVYCEDGTPCCYYQWGGSNCSSGPVGHSEGTSQAYCICPVGPPVYIDVCYTFDTFPDGSCSEGFCSYLKNFVCGGGGGGTPSCFPIGSVCSIDDECCTNDCNVSGCCRSCPDPSTYCPGQEPGDGCGASCPAGQQPTGCEPVYSPIGFIKIKTQYFYPVLLRLISVANAITQNKGIIKVAKTAGDTNTAADLVEPNAPDASPVRVKTPLGIKAWRRW